MNKIHEEILKAKSIAISGHVNPDGDCMGSCLALKNYILNKYKDVKVDVYLIAIPPAFVFMKGSDEIILTCDEEKEYDLFFSLDCGSIDRLGPFQKYFEAAKRTICIDHHVSNEGFADLSYIVPDLSSTSELIYELIDKEYIDIPVAECIYTGIIHDTGVFQYSATTSRTMAIAGELMDKGIDYPRIVSNSYFMKFITQNKLMGYALLNCELKANDKIIVSILPQSVIQEYNGVPSDLEGIVAQLRCTFGVEAAIFAYERTDGSYKISMRSNGKVNVAIIASDFNGGGHVMAAGCNVDNNIEEGLERIISRIEEQL